MIAIKPERLLEPAIERWLVGRLSLTLSVGHTPGLRPDLLHPLLCSFNIYSLSLLVLVSPVIIPMLASHALDSQGDMP